MELLRNIFGTIFAVAIGVFVVRVFWVSSRDRHSSGSRKHEGLPGTRYYSGSSNPPSDPGGRP